jgi:UrcA family protein
MMVDLRKLACMCAAGFIGTLLFAASIDSVQAQTVSHPVTVMAERPNILTRVVPFGDLSLSTAHGRHVLVQRVSLAVNEVCPELDEYGTPLDLADCQHFAWAGARPQIRTAFDAARSGAPLAMSITITSVASH